MEPNAFVVRVFGPDGTVAGVGALVGQRWIVTCAHVVNAALGRDPLAQGRPDGVVSVDFPLAAPGEGPLSASVVAWVPPPRPGAAGDDVAGLLLTGAPPAGTTPGKLGVEAARAGQQLVVFGYPGRPPRPDGVFVPATVRGRVGRGRLQLDSGQEGAHRIQPGFSGSPVFDEALGRIVGMLSESAPVDAATRDSYAISADQLRTAWPEALAGSWQRASTGERDARGRGRGRGRSELTILHVSDLQFGKNSLFGGNGRGGNGRGPNGPDSQPDGDAASADVDAEALFGHLHDDLAGLARDHGLQPDLLVVSGDLTASGLPSEFRRGMRFLAELCEAAEIPRRHVAIVPGNHDVNQGACAAYFAEQASREEPVVPPYFPKWRDYAAAFAEFYADVPGVTFTPDEPWTLFEMPELNVVVAGLNSTVAESHLEADHYGLIGQRQLEWFARKMETYVTRGWVRLATVHHNVLGGAALGAENLRDVDDLDRMLNGLGRTGRASSQIVQLLLHGHPHDTKADRTKLRIPLFSTGTSAVETDARPTAVPNQYQLVTVRRDGYTRHTRQYSPGQRGWIGDTRIAADGSDWRARHDHRLFGVYAAFPDPQELAAPDTEETDAAETDALPTPEAGPSASMTATAGRDVYLVGRDLRVTLAGEGGPGRRLSGLQLGSHNVQNNYYGDVASGTEESFLARVAEATEARYPGARIAVRSGSDCDYLRISLPPVAGGMAQQWPVGVFDGPASEEALGSFATRVHSQFKADDPQVQSELVYRGAAASAQLVALARRQGVRLRSFVEYQGLVDLGPLAERQHARLAADPAYPAELYVEQRFRMAETLTRSGGGIQTGLISQAAHWLGAEDARLVVVLGDFGRGKTSFLRQLTRRLPDELPGVLPILVELRTLEKAPTLDELLGQHLIRNEVEEVNPAKLRYMIRSGRLALLFDGFDELELRVGYDNAADYLQTLLDSVTDRAKVMLTSRTQHFRSTDQVNTALGARVETRTGSRVVVLEDFTDEQIRQFLVNVYQGDAGRADARLALLRGIENLLDLAHNPRLLSFVAAMDDDELRAVSRRGGRITQAGLYGQIIDFWLKMEAERQQHAGGLRSFDKDERLQACTALALKLWATRSPTIGLNELEAEVANTLTDLAERGYTRAQAGHSIASGSLLIRTEDGAFAFIHQSIMEWLVASAASTDSGAGMLATRQISRLMADFYVDLAGANRAVDWVTFALSAPDIPQVSKQNALTLANRLGSVGRMAGQDLSGVDLRNLDPANMDLHGATMRSVNLSGMRIDGIDLSGADLQDADLTGIRMTGGSLRDADLKGSRWTRAAILGTQGLNEVHETPGLPELRAAAVVGRDPAEIVIRPSFTPNNVAFSPDGSLLAIGSANVTEIVDARDGQVLRILRGHHETVTAVAFSPDGTLLATASDDGTARTWDAATGTQRVTLTAHDKWVNAVAFSPDGALLATASGDGTARTWDTATGTPRTTLTAHDNSVRDVAFSPDGALLATASGDRTARTWDTATGTPRTTLTGHDSGVWAVAFSPDGTLLATASEDGTARTWDTATGTPRTTLTAHHGWVNAVAFSPDGALLATASQDGTARTWDTATGTQRATLTAHDSGVWAVAFSPDGALLATASQDGTARTWDTATGTQRATLTAHDSGVNAVAFSPDGTLLATAAADGTARTWDTATGTPRTTLTAHDSGVNAVAFSPDGTLLATASQDGTARTWDTATGTQRATLTAHDSGVNAVAFSPDGTLLATASEDGTARTWDTATGTPRTTLTAHDNSVRDVAFSPDGTLLATASQDGTARTWDTATGTQRATLTAHDSGVNAVAFSPDGTLLATASQDGTARTWDTATGTQRATLTAHDSGVNAVAFSPDGTLLATAAADGTARIWDTATGTQRATLTAHDSGVNAVAFSPDGTLLATAAADGTARIWDTATGSTLVTLVPLPEGGYATLLPDGSYKLNGDPGDRLWWAIKLCRFAPGELHPYVPEIKRLRPEYPVLPVNRPC